MGACNIELRVEGTKTFGEVKQAVDARRQDDACENGHREGYSGDFQTIRTVLDHSHKGPFDDYNAATDYCLDNAQKWESVIAVKYKGKGDKLTWLIAGWGAE